MQHDRRLQRAEHMLSSDGDLRIPVGLENCQSDDGAVKSFADTTLQSASMHHPVDLRTPETTRV